MRSALIALTLTTPLLGLAPPDPIRIGEVAPPIVAYTVDGNFDVESYYRRRYVLITFWSLDEAHKDASRDNTLQWQALKKIRQGLADEHRLLILSVCTDDMGENHDRWLKFLEGHGNVAYRDRDRPGPFRFFEDHKWVNVMQNDAHFVSSKAFGVQKTPAAFLIDPERKLRAVRIPTDKLAETIAAELKRR